MLDFDFVRVSSLVVMHAFHVGVSSRLQVEGALLLSISSRDCARICCLIASHCFYISRFTFDRFVWWWHPCYKKPKCSVMETIKQCDNTIWWSDLTLIKIKLKFKTSWVCSLLLVVWEIVLHAVMLAAVAVHVVGVRCQLCFVWIGLMVEVVVLRKDRDLEWATMVPTSHCLG